jgi:hypothetical protein
LNALYASALALQAFCLEKAFRSCIIGGLAVQRWGEPRLTLDVDLTLLTGFGREAVYVDTLLGHFRGRLPDARGFALEHRVLLLSSPSGVPLDVSLGAMPFEERTIDRSSAFEFEPGVALVTCSAEDLIVHKAFAGREKDWLDVEGIVLRRGGTLDVGLIFDELEPLLELKGAPQAAGRLRALLP